MKGTTFLRNELKNINVTFFETVKNNLPKEFVEFSPVIVCDSFTSYVSTKNGIFCNLDNKGWALIEKKNIRFFLKNDEKYNYINLYFSLGKGKLSTILKAENKTKIALGDIEFNNILYEKIKDKTLDLNQEFRPDISLVFQNRYPVFYNLYKKENKYQKLFNVLKQKRQITKDYFYFRLTLIIEHNLIYSILLNDEFNYKMKDSVEINIDYYNNLIKKNKKENKTENIIQNKQNQVIDKQENAQLQNEDKKENEEIDEIDIDSILNS